MSGPDRPLSLARMRLLPAGAVVSDYRGELWLRDPDDVRGRRGWFRSVLRRTVASAATLHADRGPLTLFSDPETAGGA